MAPGVRSKANLRDCSIKWRLGTNNMISDLVFLWVFIVDHLRGDFGQRTQKKAFFGFELFSDLKDAFNKRQVYDCIACLFLNLLQCLI